jgi:hypothetical protein
LAADNASPQPAEIAEMTVMRIIEWTGENMHGLAKLGLSRILTECDDDGQIVREIGFMGKDVRYVASAVDNSIEYRGLFEMQLLSPDSRVGPDDVSRTEFEAHWKQARS